MTISKSNFIVISVVLAAVLFLFQFSNISAQYTSQATKNKNAEPSIQIQAILHYLKINSKIKPITLQRSFKMKFSLKV